MLVLFEGLVRVAYGQVYVYGGGGDEDDDGSMEAAFAGQVNGLCGAAAPGRLFLVTGSTDGRVRFTVELYDQEPPLPPTGWEEVVEVAFHTTTAEVQLAEWGGAARSLDFSHGRPPEDAGYRARYSAAGMAEARHADVDIDVPRPDRYLLQFWPALPGPAQPDAVLRQTTPQAQYWHDCARRQPPPPSARHRAEAKRQAQDAQRQRAAEIERRHELDRWGGREPNDRLRQVGGPLVTSMARIDADLLHDIAATAPDTQRRIARWTARQAFAVAGIPALDWLTPLWRALDAGQPLPAAMADARTLLYRIIGAEHGRGHEEPATPELPRDPPTKGPQGPPTHYAAVANRYIDLPPDVPATVPDELLPRDLDATPAAVMALTLAFASDPLKAAIETVWAATGAYADDLPTFLAEIRRAFPDLGPPKPTKPAGGDHP